jgi:hypothetical protein
MYVCSCSHCQQDGEGQESQQERRQQKQQQQQVRPVPNAAHQAWSSAKGFVWLDGPQSKEEWQEASGQQCSHLEVCGELWCLQM